MNGFRFGVNLRFSESAREWAEKCERAEELGYDVITVPDHLGGPERNAPFPALVAAAAATERVRLGTLVLNVPFYNPALLAREVATTWQLSSGRLELGLGSGHMRREFTDAGLPFPPARERIDFLRHTVGELRERLGESTPPVLIAGNSDGVLRLAAEHADTVGFSGLRQAPGKEPGTFHLASDGELGERVALYAGHAGERAESIERNMLIQHVVRTDDRSQALRRFKADEPALNLDLAQLEHAPQLLFGTDEQNVERIREQRRKHGFSYFSVQEHAMEDFAPVVRALAAE